VVMSSSRARSEMLYVVVMAVLDTEGMRVT
jgi:hypothetical protein